MRLRRWRWKAASIVAAFLLFSGLAGPRPALAEETDDSLAALITRYLKYDDLTSKESAAPMFLPADLATAKKVALDAMIQVEAYDIDAFEFLQPYFPKAHSIKDLRRVDSTEFYDAMTKFLAESYAQFTRQRDKTKRRFLGLIEDSPKSKYLFYRSVTGDESHVWVDVLEFRGGRWYVSLEGQWIYFREAVVSALVFSRLHEEK